ncbi:acetyl-CoA synthetase-like protein [Aspergillus welwitschiae]|uniref:Acetyl-CoA synthetase-like protein n=1 Tax=Aspergillus welwitschiae TaxID=1341132 RepID=A0A3F3QCA8_9EURO|nr:acetyl-CoA synthetase-like protein [Aspergillus welwitschiae]RDH36767.1 acetyl-CoA synthetase-like protein [Aspergillus welwitschiae]
MEHKEKGSGIFPCLNNGVGMESSVRLQDVLPSPAQDIERFCRVHGITTLHFIETVWLIVLGPFLDADRVCFGYRDHRDRPPDPTSGPAKVIESDSFPDASVAEMLKTGFCAEPGNPSDEQPPAHNTAVVLIKEIAGSDRSYLLEEAKQWDYGVVLSLVHKTSTLSPCLAENLSSTDLTLFSPLNRDNSPATSLIKVIQQRACERPHHPALDCLATQWASHLQRLELAILKAVNATVAITSTDLVPILSSLLGTIVIISSETTSNLPTTMSDVPARDITLETTAYGCVAKHRALANLANLAPSLKITAESRVLQSASYGFVMAMESMLSLVSPLAFLKTLVLAGEPIRTDLFQMWAHQLDLHLVLGCTEWADIRCIGTSPTGRLCPGLADGYLNNASQTASAFINAPAWYRMMGPVNDTGVTLYKTGDLVQYYADGKIRYIGRKNTQVKIRGKRLELGEIEYHIPEAAAPKGSETPIEALLLRFQAHVDSIKKGLEQVLPDHMWPSIYLPLESKLRHIICTSTRQDLENDLTPASPIVPPATELELELHQLFAETLHVEPISFGVNHSFIRLGGDSVTAMRLANRCNILQHQTDNAPSSTPAIEHLTPERSFPPVSESGIQDEFVKVLEASISATDAFTDRGVDSAMATQLITGNEILPIIAALAKRPVTRSTEPVLHPDSTRYLLPLATRLRGHGIEVQIIDMALKEDQDIWDALQSEQRTTFNLEDEPGWRPLVFRLGPDDHILSIVMHHIISDGWSVDILRNELNIFYSAAIRSCEPLSQVDPLPTHYQDKSQSRPAELLCDKPRPAILSGDAGRRTRFCRAHRVTAHTVLLATFRAAQYRLTGRYQHELEPLIGFFINLQCIRTEVEHARTTFYHLVQQDIPFERIVSELADRRDLSRNPLVQMVFAVHSQTDLGNLSIEGVEAEPLTLSSTSRFDLEFHMYQGRDCFRGEILFSLDLFHQETIDILHALFIDVLHHGLTQPATPIDLIQLNDANGTLHQHGLLHIQEKDYPLKCCPAKIAVKDSSTELTYHELDSQSDRVAIFLTNQSLAPESVIGVFADRGCETIVAFLGVLKANMAYLPLDVKSPMGRLETILSSAHMCKIILLGSRIERPALSISDLQLIPIPDILTKRDRDDPTISHTSLTMMPSAESTAYIIYTSGSTGVPKGVMIQHRAILRLARCTDIISHHNNPGAIAHTSNIAFDMSVWEIYTALLNGQTLVCIDPMAVLNYKLLGHIFAHEGVQIAMLTPAMLKQCLIESASTISQLEILLIGGDCLDPSDAITARTLVKSELINAYGPTENGVVSTLYRIPDNGIFPNGVPIGRSINDSAAYVMDPSNRLVPVGVMGALVVTGDGLAKGYVDSQLDIGRFVTVHIPGRSPIRAYQTGDCVRYRPSDGQLEFFGRMDQQIKIRGHRIELGEIDHVLLQNSTVSDAVTVVDRREGHEPQIVSFVTVRSDPGQIQATQRNLQGWLEGRLPSYMIPQTIEVLNQMPINSSGKVDRQKLARMAEVPTPCQPTMDQLPPIDEVERTVLEELTAMLGVEMRVTDNFFRVGGHSLMATRMASRIMRRLDVEITVRDIFEYPTAASLAEKIRNCEPTKYVPILPIEHKKPAEEGESGEQREAVELSFAQGRLWMLEQMNPGQSWYHTPFAVRLQGSLNLEALGKAFFTLAQRHESLRTTFETRRDHPVQVVHPHPFDSRPLTVIDVSARPDADLAAVLHREQTAPFDLTTDPAWRVAAIRLGPETHVLSVVIHHILCDALFYASAVRGEYRDFAAWQHELEYWFLCDKPRPASFAGAAGVCQIQVEGTTYQVTPFVVLLTGSTDATIGTPVANRNRQELEDLVGFFVNLQCIRIPIEEVSFLELVEQVHVPFEHIVNTTQTDPFVLHSEANMAAFHLEGIDTEPVDLVPTSRFDMEFHLYQKHNTIEGYILYAESLFTAQTIEIIQQTFAKILKHCLLLPSTTPGAFPLVDDYTSPDAAAMGQAYGHCTDYPRDMNVVEAFQQQVASFPNRIALDSRSDRVASWLSVLSLPVETPVAVLANRSSNLAYLPLDVRAPAGRIETLLSFIRNPPITEASMTSTYLLSRPSATSLAYIIFTSGSTGQPKGVMVEHRGIIRLVKGSNVVGETEAACSVAHMSNLAFDASTWEIFTALLNGGTVVCIDSKTVADYSALGEAFQRESVRMALFTPALLKQCLTASPATVSMLDTLVTGGDVLDPDDVVKVKRLPRQPRVINAYGPTENTGRFITLAVGSKTVRGYRTGDIVRYRPGDGQLEYFGRIDQQVKIRGHRVELTEIDQYLLAFSFIQEAVSIYRKEEALGSDLDWHATMGVSGQDTSGQVQVWGEFFETNVYHLSGLHPSERGRDFRGWKSMYTGAPIEKAEMNEWLDDTIGALLNGGSPGHVFEVGTGTGMILFNVVEGLQSYVGLEPSIAAFEFVQAAVPSIPGLEGKVRLQKGTADDISRLDRSNPVDVAIINSVAQYFPSPGYLLRVVEDLVCLQGAKRIFLGDLRSYALYEEFQVSKALYGETHGVPTMANIRSQMAETVHLEEELLVDPAFFTSLPSRVPQLIQHVEILPKRMVATNELSCYRYAAVLYAKQQPNLELRIHDVEESQWIDFSARKMNRESLFEYLRQQTIDTSLVAISNIPYSKINLERLVVDLLKDRLVERIRGPGWLASLSERAKKLPSLAAPDLIELAEKTGFHVEISWARQHSQRGGLDAIFHRIEPAQKGARVLFRFPTDHQGRAPGQLSNNPLQLSSNRDMEKWVRKALQKSLPTYMVPRLVRVLERMPINSNGKIDRKALASMVAGTVSQNTVSARVDPRDDLERALLHQFTKALGQDIGVLESLFDHGGHSLTAIKLVNGINEQLHTRARASDVFECPTVAGLAARIRSWPGSITRPVASTFSLVGGNLSPATSGELAKIGLSPTEVADIVPVTNTQAWFLTRWAPVSMRLNLHGRIDINQWRTACHAVAQKHSTLRTLFTRLEGRFVQVILRAVNVPFTKLTSDTVADEAHSRLSPVSTKLYTRFELVSQSPTSHSFIVRLSHAQYDGFSLPLLFSDLASAYNGNLLSPSLPVPFSDYVYGCAYHRSADSLSFWNDYLRGARLTTLSDTTLSGDYKAVDVKQTVTGELPTSLPGITFPTLVNAAFAFTLAEMVCSQDVTFGLVLNTRDLPINGVEAILGPCINLSPVRVQSQQAWTVSELCQNLHDSYTAVSRHGYLELPDIVANCTDWPRDSDFGCLINHFPPDRTPSFSLKDADVVDFSMDTRIDLTDQLLVRSIVGDGTWEVQALTSSNVMSDKKASALAERLLKTAQRFSQYPEAPLSSHLLR